MKADKNNLPQRVRRLIDSSPDMEDQEKKMLARSLGDLSTIQLEELISVLLKHEGENQRFVENLHKKYVQILLKIALGI